MHTTELDNSQERVYDGERFNIIYDDVYSFSLLVSFSLFNSFKIYLLHQTKEQMGEVMKEAQFSLAEAKFAVGNDINAVVLQNVTRAQTKVSVQGN